MTVRSVWVPFSHDGQVHSGREISVSGIGYEPVGEFSEDGNRLTKQDPRSGQRFSRKPSATPLALSRRKKNPMAPSPSGKF